VDVDGSSGRVAVVGQGYVGLPLAMRAAEVGHQVVGFDTDPVVAKTLVTVPTPLRDANSGLSW
jgi:UDP-N-acetyl-D-glucosamine dehydrogenase